MKLLRKCYDVANKWGVLNLLSDKTHITLKYRLSMGHPLNWKNPQTFTEKLNWLKLYDHDLRYPGIVDKWEVTDFVKERIGEDCCAKKFGVWEHFDDIDFDALPNQFVLKCTHDSGGVVICKDKGHFDREAARKKLEASLKKNYYWLSREWPYKEIKPRILAEEYLEDSTCHSLPDYKFFCFNGEPKFLFVATGRAEGNTCFDFFDTDYRWLPVRQHYPNAATPPEKPACFDEMLELSRKLSAGFKHVRVDFFQVNGKVYFGELTLTHFAGYHPYEPESYDSLFGSYLNLENR